MELILYISAICVIVFGMILFFIVSNAKQKKRVKAISASKPIAIDQNVEIRIEKNEPESLAQPIFLEEYSLEQEEPQTSQEEPSFEDRFAEYQQFLRENMKYEDDSDAEDFNEFDLDMIRTKSNDNIDDMIENLPPDAQDLLIGNVLDRKNYDEED